MISVLLSCLAISLVIFNQIETAPVPTPKRWEIVAVGDIMLGRGVGKKIEQIGWQYPFSGMLLVSDPCQLLVANLESPLTKTEFRSTSLYKFKGDPQVAGNILKQNGFGFLSIANNHAYDCGVDGLAESIHVLDSLKIPYSGISENRAVAGSGGYMKITTVSRPEYMDIAGIRVGFLGFCQPYLISPGKKKISIAPADSAMVCNSINAIKDSCQVIITSFHWGNEYQRQPTKFQKDMGRLAIRSGAKIVHGHHPHIIEGVEFYKDGIIAYSMGNFIFDQNDSLPNQSAVLHIIMRDIAVDSVWIEPIAIKEKRPMPMEKDLASIFKLHFEILSKNFNTQIKFVDNKLYLFGPEEKE